MRSGKASSLLPFSVRSPRRSKKASGSSGATVFPVGNGKSHGPTRNSLNSFDAVVVDEQIAERAVGLRRGHRIKLPDAVIIDTKTARREVS